jgi:phosphate transport system substrate-binding protein
MDTLYSDYTVEMLMMTQKAWATVLVFLLVGGIVGLIGGWLIGSSQQQAQQGERVITVTRTITETKQATVTVTAGGPPTQPPAELRGEIVIDGSSTVYPITEAAAEEFMKRWTNVKISVGISGTGGGFKRFVVGETDINDASRPILRSEHETATKNGIEWIEVPVAIDGLSVVVNVKNTFVDCLTISELREIWKPDSTVKKWSDIRPGWPDQPILLYGPGPDSGTFDYFTERVVGKLKASRTDYVASEDDNVLVAGVEAEQYALGYFGYAYYTEAKDRIRVVPIRDDEIQGSTCVTPTDETVQTFEYPLSRPLFIYVNKKSWSEKPWVREFVIFYLENGVQLVRKVGYTPLPPEYYNAAAALLKSGITDKLYALAAAVWKNAGPH